MEQLYSNIFHVALGDVLMCFAFAYEYRTSLQMKKVSFLFIKSSQNYFEYGNIRLGGKELCVWHFHNWSRLTNPSIWLVEITGEVHSSYPSKCKPVSSWDPSSLDVMTQPWKKYRLNFECYACFAHLTYLLPGKPCNWYTTLYTKWKHTLRQGNPKPESSTAELRTESQSRQMMKSCGAVCFGCCCYLKFGSWRTRFSGSPVTTCPRRLRICICMFQKKTNSRPSHSINQWPPTNNFLKAVTNSSLLYHAAPPSPLSTCGISCLGPHWPLCPCSRSRHNLRHSRGRIASVQSQLSWGLWERWLLLCDPWINKEEIATYKYRLTMVVYVLWMGWEYDRTGWLRWCDGDGGK